PRMGEYPDLYNHLFEIFVKLPAPLRKSLLICIGALFLGSCAGHRSTGNLRDARMFKFNALKEGTEEVEVGRVLGPPDEIRMIQGSKPLDESLVSDARPGHSDEETHRWAYGPERPGTFARTGIVSFGGSNTVVWAESPVWRRGGVFNEVLEAHPQKLSSSA